MRFGDVLSAGTAFASSYGYLMQIPDNATNVYLLVTNNQFDKCFVCFYDKNKISLGFSSITTSKEIPSGAKYIDVRVGKSDSVSGTTYKTKVMVAFSSISSYEKYITPTSYQLSLGDIELCGIGNYKDELIYDVENDKVYKNEKIGKVVFNGSETGWERNTTTLGYRYRINQLDIKPNADNSTIASMYCNYLRATSPDKLFNLDNYTISCFSGTAHTVIIACISNETDTLEKWKTWLGTHNTTVYYVLAEEVKEEITGTLKDQVKALYNAHSNNGTTIITSNGNLPMIIKVRGLKGE